jgi:integrase
MKVPAVTREDVERFMHAVATGETAQRTKTGKKRGLSNVRGGKGAAARTLGLLGAIFACAERRRMVPENPVRGVIRYADGKRGRRLSDAEYAALGKGLAAAAPPKPPKDGKPGRAAMWPAAIAATRFLALTGWRSGEALTLRWGMVDLARRTARLTDTKTGASLRPLSAAACDVLRASTRAMPCSAPPTASPRPRCGSWRARPPPMCWKAPVRSAPPPVADATARRAVRLRRLRANRAAASPASCSVITPPRSDDAGGAMMCAAGLG